MSATVYLFVHMEYSRYIMGALAMGKRFDAYAGDPNYYAMYLCLAMALLLTGKKYSHWDLLFVIGLAAIGFLTASKMCFLMMAFIVGYAIVTQFLKHGDQGKLTRRIIGTLVVALIILWKYIYKFLENLLLRTGLDVSISSSISLSQITTGRSTIVANYIHILTTNVAALLFGAGMSYHLFLGEASNAGAHNTYLDIILAWGMLGAFLMLYVGIYFMLLYRKQHPGSLTFGLLLPLFCVFINFVDLSCFNATMFWFVLAAALSSLSEADRQFVVGERKQ